MTTDFTSGMLRDEVAALAGITPDTLSAYVSRGQAPAPVRHIGRTPVWSASDVLDWIATRNPARTRKDR